MISVVVPVHDEEESLAALHGELARGVRRPGRAGRSSSSSSTTAAATAPGGVLAELARRDPRVGAIRFRRNFGKAAALTAGFQAARGELVFTLDGDLQDDPAEIPRFLDRARAGLRRGQRLEEDPPRPLAQGLSQPGLQLDGQPPDRLPPARPQLRIQALPPRGAATRSASTASCTGSSRCWRTPAASASARSRSGTAAAAMGRRSTASRGSSRGSSTC